MNENINQNTNPEPADDDVEAHRVRNAPVDERVRPGLVEDDEYEYAMEMPQTRLARKRR